MNRIRQKLDAIVYRLKQTEALRGVRFVREYAAEAAETPVNGWVAAVSVARAEREKGYLGGFLSPDVRGESYSVTAEIYLYAPAGGNGSGLSEMTAALLEAIEAADEEKLVTDAAASAIAFDADLSAVFRKVEMQLHFCLCEEV